MATALLPNDDFYKSTNVKSLEIFSLIWLDANVDVKGTRDTEVKLRSIINHIKKFQDINECQKYIQQTSQKDRLVIIVSGRLGREIVSSIYKLRQVISIYVYCTDKKTNENWASKFSKVKAVVVDLDELIIQIKENHKIQKKLEEPLLYKIYTTSASAGQSTMNVDGQFVFSQVLIDCLLRLKSNETDRTELFDSCKNQYEDNHTELNNLHEFKKDYLPNKVLWWYTKETFFYKTLNAVLRAQDIHMIFLFREFISDICQQLQKYQSNNSLRVYRSQMMATDELEMLKQNIGQLISINSFFSTSTDYSKAVSFLNFSDASEGLERVLFEIYADPKMATTKPFADISRHSYYPDESEALFMIGSIFRLKSINRNDKQIWIIEITLCSDDEYDLKQVLMYMKQQIGSGETNLRTLGKVLWKMGKLDLAGKYFNRLLNELQPNDPLLSILYEDLGALRSKVGKRISWTRWKKAQWCVLVAIKLRNKILYRRQAFIIIQSHIRMYLVYKRYASRIQGLIKVKALYEQFAAIEKIVRQVKFNKEMCKQVEQLRQQIHKLITEVTNTSITSTQIENACSDLGASIDRAFRRSKQVLVEQEIEKEERLKRIQMELEREKNKELAIEMRKPFEQEKEEFRQSSAIAQDQKEGQFKSKLTAEETKQQKERQAKECDKEARLTKINERERRDHDLARHIALETGSEADLPCPHRSRRPVIKQEYDLTKHSYAELRDILNKSCDLELLDACREEFHKRLKVYHAWKVKNRRAKKSSALDEKLDEVDEQRAPQDFLNNEISDPISMNRGASASDEAIQEGKLSTIAFLNSSKDTDVKGSEQRYFCIPFVRSNDQNRDTDNEQKKEGWWYAHFEGKWIVRQMEIHPDRKAVLLVAGVDDTNMCKLSLDEICLTSRKGAEILESDFEQKWLELDGKQYLESSFERIRSKYVVQLLQKYR
ncbi:unnamed protein product [Adineta steineri]|uniref:Uncharacterized protein n=1 Tax=Adineta steineri TaxID=433720 RepID=A0A815HD55_9BILA|nr:unnamed protein product [Adineta steineri]CAF1545356.1 unnamed protein product [Adineta steineri]